MNLILSFAFFIVLLQFSWSIFGSETTEVSSATHDAQTLLRIADEFLYCFNDQSFKKLPPIQQTYTDAVARVIRSFTTQHKDSLSEADAIVLQTNLATSIVGNVDAESKQSDDPQKFPKVLQLISDCFTVITGYRPSKLIRGITSFSTLSSEDAHREWNSDRVDRQEIPSKSQSLEYFENQAQLKSFEENSKFVAINEIPQPAYDRRPVQTSRSSFLVAGGSSVNISSLNTKANKRTKFSPFTKQLSDENNDSFKVKELESDLGFPECELDVNQSSVILPVSSSYSYTRISAISKFSIAFSNALKSLYDVTNAFKTSLHPILASKAYYNAVYNAVYRIKRLNPVSIARIFSVAVKATFNDLTTSQHIMTYGNVVGKYLKSRNLLTSRNALKLSSSYVNFIKRSVANVRTIGSRDASIQAIVDGLMNFLVCLKVFPIVNFFDLATDFADSVFSFTGVKRTNISSLSPVCDGLIFQQISDNDSNFKSNIDKSSLNVINRYHNTRNDVRVDILHNGFISENSTNCSMPSVISLFTLTFSETIFFSENLANAFEKRLYGAFLSEVLFSTLYDYFKKLGVTDATSHCISNSVYQLVNTSYYAITPVVITNTISHVIGRELFDHNLLSMQNFEQLSDSYINFLEISFRSFDSNHTTRSIITSILEGSGNFLSSQKISLVENVKIMAKYFEMALNSSIESRFSFHNAEFNLCSFWDESDKTDFDSFEQNSEAYTSEQPNTTVFSNYVLDEILFNSHLSRLFDLSSINSPAADRLYDNLNFLFSDSVGSPQYVADLIRHEIVKTSESPNSFSFAELFVKSLERFLTARHVLKPKNAIVMARAFMSAINEAVTHTQNQNSDYNLNIIINTTGLFLEKYLIFGIDHEESWSSMLLSDLFSNSNFFSSQLVNEMSSEFLEPSGLLSTKSLTRINNLALAVRTNILSSDEVNITSFTYHLIAGALQNSNDYPTLKPEKALFETFLEGIASLIAIINGASITSLDVWSYQNVAIEMCEALSGFLNL